MPFAAMPAAFDAGRVDAAEISEPFVSVAAKSARVLVYGYDCIARDFLLGAWFTTAQWAKDHDVHQRRRRVAGRCFGRARYRHLESGAARKRDQPRHSVRVRPEGVAYSTSLLMTVLCVAKDGPIHAAKDFAGQTIAVSALKDLTDLAQQQYLEKNGVDTSTVKTIELPFAEMGPASRAAPLPAP